MSRFVVKGISEGPKRLSKLLKASVGIPSSADGPDEDHWVVGGRYQVLQSTMLYARPDLSSEKLGNIRQKDNILLLALQNIQSQTSSGEVLLAYMANTKTPEWVCGWGQIEASAETQQVLRRRRLSGSWEVGGRYIINGSPVLRSRIELESEALFDILPNEEVLILDLGLVIRSGEPRLRARVRTDAGDLGWLTIELPGGSALLEPLNLYSAEALHRRASVFGEKHKKSGISNRVTLNGQIESSTQAWEAGGKYRLAERVVVHEEADPKSRVIGELRRGILVLVRAVDLQSGSDVPIRLQIFAENIDVIGWISPLTPNGEKLLDSRDHSEFEKLMILHQQQAQEQAEQELAAAPTAPEPPLPPPDNLPPALTQEWANPPTSWQEIENLNPMSMDAPGPSLEEASPSFDASSTSPAPQHNALHGDAPNIALMSAHAKNDLGAASRERQENKLNSGSSVARPWEHNGANLPGYRTLREMDSADERQVGDNIENEWGDSICSCRNGLLNCGAAKAWTTSMGMYSMGTTKVKSRGPAPMNHGYMGEPAPEPRPMRQLPSPPGVHATTMPNN